MRTLAELAFSNFELNSENVDHERVERLDFCASVLHFDFCSGVRRADPIIVKLDRAAVTIRSAWRTCCIGALGFTGALAVGAILLGVLLAGVLFWSVAHPLRCEIRLAGSG